MTLTKEQIAGLQAAYKRKQAGWVNSPQSKQTDIKNLNYAISKNLWSPKKNQSSFTDVKSFAEALKENLMDKFNKGEIGQKKITPPHSSPTNALPKQKTILPAGSNALNGEVIKTTTPTPNALQALQQKYLESLKQTEKEISLQEKLNKQLQTTETGVEKIEAKPILTNLLWGQKERLLKQSGITTGALQRQLALEQAKRTGIQQQLGTQIGWETQAERQRLENERFKQQQEFQTQQQQTAFQRNLALKGYSKISNLDELQGLTEDDIIRMPNGDIYKKPIEAGTSAIQEYNLAKKEGYTGDFMDFLASRSKVEQDPIKLMKDQLQIQKYMKDIRGDLDYKDKVKLELTMSNDFEKFAKEAKTSMRNVNIIKTGYNEAVKAGFDGSSLNPASQAILVTFQKMLDPTSVVRESEYARSSRGESWVNRLKGLATTIRQGGANVPQSSLKEFYDMTLELEKSYQNEMLNFAQRTKTQADGYGLELERILTPDVLDILTRSDYDSFGFDESYDDMVAEFGQEAIKNMIENLKKKL